MEFSEFLQLLQDEEERSFHEAFINRNQELAGIKESNLFNRYAILITVEPDPQQLLLEHEQYKHFKKSTDLYFKHPANADIPVKAHYHVVDGKSKKEIYAVNMDGSAHHRKNRGFEIPKRQAEELKQLGVQLPANNFLELKEATFNEGLRQKLFWFYIVIEE